MDSFRVLELIKLCVVGRLNSKDSEEFLNLMNQHKEFPWNELGKFQNLAAVLCLPIEQLNPPQSAKEKILNSIIPVDNLDKSGEDISITVDEPANIFSKIKNDDTISSSENRGKLIIKDPDLSDLIIFDRSKEYEEVRSRVSKLREQKKETEKEKVPEKSIVKAKNKPFIGYEEEKNGKKKFTRNIFLAAGLVTVVLALTGIFYFQVFNEDVSQPNTAADDIHKELIAKSIVENNLEDDNILAVNNDEMPEQISELPPSEEMKVETELKEDLKKEENKESIVKTKESQNNLPPLENPKMISAPLIDPVEKEETPIEKSTLLASETPPPSNGTKIVEEEQNYFIAVEEMPEPIGGLSSIQSKIVYPELAIRAGVEGKVYVRAFVDENGLVTKVEVIKGIGMGCDEAAVDAVLKTKFKPGKQRGKPIKVQVTVAITFKL